MFNFLNFIFLIGHVTGNISFPKPLSQAEEEQYIEKFSKGDMDARNILIERNLRLVAHIVKKYSNLNRETDDLISIGTIGLIKGINTFKTGKGTKLSTYCARCVDNVI